MIMNDMIIKTLELKGEEERIVHWIIPVNCTLSIFEQMLKQKEVKDNVIYGVMPIDLIRFRVNEVYLSKWN